MSVHEKMTAIADAIRGYTGRNDKLSLDSMATGVSEVFGVGNQDGYNIGYNEGLSEGRTQGYGLGFEEGKAAEYNEFWNYYQQNGTRTDYTNIFASAGWTAEIFKPTHSIKPTIATNMFKDSTMEIDLARHLEALGIKLDFSNCTTLERCFQNSNFTKIGVIDASNVINADYNANYIFTGSSKLVTIERFIVSSSAATGASFSGCTALRNLTIGGTIGMNFSVKECVNLTKDSITSIVEHLSGTLTPRTVTFSKIAVNKAFGINVDDASTYPEGSEYYNLRYSKSNWTFNYA